MDALLEERYSLSSTRILLIADRESGDRPHVHQGLEHLLAGSRTSPAWRQPGFMRWVACPAVQQSDPWTTSSNVYDAAGPPTLVNTSFTPLAIPPKAGRIYGPRHP